MHQSKAVVGAVVDRPVVNKENLKKNPGVMEVNREVSTRLPTRANPYSVQVSNAGVSHYFYSFIPFTGINP